MKQKHVDHTAFHPTVTAVGNEAWGAFARMCSYSDEYGTLGTLQLSTARLIASRASVLDRLKRARLVSVDGDVVRLAPSNLHGDTRPAARLDATRASVEGATP